MGQRLKFHILNLYCPGVVFYQQQTVQSLVKRCNHVAFHLGQSSHLRISSQQWVDILQCTMLCAIQSWLLLLIGTVHNKFQTTCTFSVTIFRIQNKMSN